MNSKDQKKQVVTMPSQVKPAPVLKLLGTTADDEAHANKHLESSLTGQTPQLHGNRSSSRTKGSVVPHSRLRRKKRPKKKAIMTGGELEVLEPTPIPISRTQLFDDDLAYNINHQSTSMPPTRQQQSSASSSDRRENSGWTSTVRPGAFHQGGMGQASFASFEDEEDSVGDEIAMNGRETPLPIIATTVADDEERIQQQIREREANAPIASLVFENESRKQSSRWTLVLCILLIVATISVGVSVTMTRNGRFETPADSPSTPSGDTGGAQSFVPSDAPSFSSRPSLRPSLIPSAMPSFAPSTFWLQIGETINTSVTFSELTNRLAVSEDGSVVAISSAGQAVVRVFHQESTSGTWRPLGQELHGTLEDVLSSEEIEQDYALNNPSGFGFGGPIALSGDGSTLAVSDACYKSDVTLGGVVVFRLTNNNTTTRWERIGQLMKGRYENDLFGRSISLSSDGKTLAVGTDPWARYISAAAPGYVRLYDFSEEKREWVQVGGDFNDASATKFGWSVWLAPHDPNLLVVGSPYDDANQLDISGSVSLYRRLQPAGWELVGSKIEGNIEYGQLGFDVRSSGFADTIAAQSRLNFTSMIQVFSFDRITDRWKPLGEPILGETFTLSQDGLSLVVTRRASVSVYSFDGRSWNPFGVDITCDATSQNDTVSGCLAGASSDGEVVVTVDTNGIMSAYAASALVAAESLPSSAPSAAPSTFRQQLGSDIEATIFESEDFLGHEVAVSSDGLLLAGLSPSAYVQSFRYNATDDVWEQYGQTVDAFSGGVFEFSRDGMSFVVPSYKGPCCDNPSVKIFAYTADTDTWLLASELETIEPVTGLSLSSDSNYLAIVTKGYLVYVYNRVGNSNTVWQQDGKTIFVDENVSDWFADGSIEISDNGRILLILAPYSYKTLLLTRSDTKEIDWVHVDTGGVLNGFNIVAFLSTGQAQDASPDNSRDTAILVLGCTWCSMGVKAFAFDGISVHQIGETFHQSNNTYFLSMALASPPGSDGLVVLALGSSAYGGVQTFLLRNGGSSWEPFGPLLRPMRPNAEYFGSSVSLSEDGRTLAIGAAQEIFQPHGSNDNGFIRVVFRDIL